MKTINIALIGDSGAGKTTFLEAFDRSEDCQTITEETRQIYFPEINTQFNFVTYYDVCDDVHSYNGAILMFRDDMPDSFENVIKHKIHKIPCVLVCNRNQQGDNKIQNEVIVNTLMHTPVGTYCAYYEINTLFGHEINKPLKFFL